MDAQCPCKALLIDNDRVREARQLILDTDRYGNLHAFVIDGNLEDHWFQSGAVARSVKANHAASTPEELAEEKRLMELLASMTEEERFAAYGMCMDCIERRYPAPNAEAIPGTIQ